MRMTSVLLAREENIFLPPVRLIEKNEASLRPLLLNGKGGRSKFPEGVQTNQKVAGFSGYLFVPIGRVTLPGNSLRSRSDPVFAAFEGVGAEGRAVRPVSMERRPVNDCSASHNLPKRLQQALVSDPLAFAGIDAATCISPFRARGGAEPDAAGSAPDRLLTESVLLFAVSSCMRHNVRSAHLLHPIDRIPCLALPPPGSTHAGKDRNFGVRSSTFATCAENAPSPVPPRQ